MKRAVTTKMLVESGILLAVGFVLSMIKVPVPFPGAGSITLVSMLPLVVLGYKYGAIWGGLCGLVHSLLQLVEGGWFPPPVPGIHINIAVFLLDYALAWAAVGFLAGVMARVIPKTQAAMCAGAFAGLLGRYLCSFVSGVLIWGVYAPEGQTAVYYSLTANGAYMIPEIIVTSVVAFAAFSVPVMRQQVRKSELV